MATHSSILAWKIPRTEEPGRLRPMGSQTDTTEQLHFLLSSSHRWRRLIQVWFQVGGELIRSCHPDQGIERESGVTEKV